MAEYKAKRDNAGKPPLGLIPLSDMVEIALVIQDGNRKYGIDNWKKGFSSQTVLDSMSRHYAALQSGAVFDAESRRHHAAHLATNCIHWLYFDLHGGWINE